MRSTNWKLSNAGTTELKFGAIGEGPAADLRLPRGRQLCTSEIRVRAAREMIDPMVVTEIGMQMVTGADIGQRHRSPLSCRSSLTYPGYRSGSLLRRMIKLNRTAPF